MNECVWELLIVLIPPPGMFPGWDFSAVRFSGMFHHTDLTVVCMGLEDTGISYFLPTIALTCLLHKVVITGVGWEKLDVAFIVSRNGTPCVCCQFAPSVMSHWVCECCSRAAFVQWIIMILRNMQQNLPSAFIMGKLCTSAWTKESQQGEFSLERSFLYNRK